MKNLGLALGSFFALSVLLALLAAGYFLLQYVLNVFAALDPQTETLAAISTVVALLCAVIIAEGVRAHGQSSRKAAKTAMYERVLSISTSPAQAIPQRSQTEHSLALSGSARVISAYLKIRRCSSQPGGEEHRALLNALVTEMRRDLGQPDFIRKQDDILELLLDKPQ